MTIKTAGIVIINKDKVLLVRHGSKAGHKTGVYGLPAGRINREETTKQCAIRELREETGLETKTENIIKISWTYIAEIERKGGMMKFSLEAFLCEEYQWKLKKSKETYPEWISIQKISDIPLLPNVKEIISKGTYLQNNQPPIIKRIILDVTSKCNLKCPMCWGPPRTIHPKTSKFIDQELSLREIRKILAFMKKHFSSSILTINGGEPLIKKDIINILKLAKKLDYSTTLSTNWILFNQKIEILKYIDAISIPIDAATSATSKIMRPPLNNHYEIALQTIKQINMLNKNMYIKASTVVSWINKNEILKIGEEIINRKLKIDTRKLFQYNPVWYRQEDPMKKKLIISKGDFDKIGTSVKRSFPKLHIHSQWNDESWLYLLIRPDGSITIQKDKNGKINPHLGNILLDKPTEIITQLQDAINPVAEKRNAYQSYGLE